LKEVLIYDFLFSKEITPLNPHLQKKEKEKKTQFFYYYKNACGSSFDPNLGLHP
jgi:hypothetical protein